MFFKRLANATGKPISAVDVNPYRHMLAMHCAM